MNKREGTDVRKISKRIDSKRFIKPVFNIVNYGVKGWRQGSKKTAAAPFLPLLFY